ncbi:MAG: UvrD-helicase domain-containing protein, partial [Candidatus Melainabacteria bacterium]|nr:UvrD-helicase domain-containing protein [Candidatus Melainabacteria bacterium]
MAKSQRESEQPNKIPVQPIDCREALHWFVETVGLYKGSARGLLVSNFDEANEPYLESAIINLKSRGITPAVVEGAAIYQQAARLWDQAVRGSSFGRPVATQFELDLTGSPVTVINNFTAPQTAQQLWYLYHHILYPRAVAGKPLLITTKHDYWELVGLGGECEDLEYAGRKVTWEKVLYILDATTIDLHHFSQMKEEGLPAMLKAEYYLYKTLKAREFPITAMHVVGDYMLDFAIYNRHAKLDVEIDNVSSLDGSGSYSAEAKKNLELLSDGWRIVRLTNSEILSNVVACADAVEDVWRGGLKKSSYGRLISGNSNIVVPELTVEDEVQRLAISHGAGPAAITGSAGCGKTTVLAHRIVSLLNQGINPESILVISYSKETMTPLRAMVDEIGDKLLAQKVSFYTWHDLGFKILKENLSAIKRKPPLKVEQNVLKVIQRLLQKYKKDLDPVTLELSDELDEFTLVSLISLYKANLVAPKHVKERGKGAIDELVAKVFQAYDDQLQKANRVDRDDMITLSANLLVDNPEVRARYQYQFEYVLIDEYQDASAAMDLLARLLSFPQDNLFIVGDEDTAIWEAKGSLPRLLPEVSLRLPNARCYTLDKNWRCHPAIVENARHIVRALEHRRMQKDFTTGWGPAPTEAVIGPQILADEMAESEWVADEMQILIDSGRLSGEIVVLYRQNNYAILIEEALTRRAIRCIATRHDAGMIPDEVGDVMAFLRLVMDPDGPKARESFERICQLRVKEVDPKLSATIASFGEANNLSYLKAVEIYSEAVSDPSCIDLAQLVRIIRTMHAEKLPPAETISLLKRTQRLNEYYKSIKVPAGVNYEPLRKLAQLEEEARQYKSVSEFVKAFSARQQDQGEGNEGPVRILNVNETKGLEYPIVFIVGMSDGLFPSDVADLEEERRLFYLAVTRARELLYVSSPSSFNGESLLPSFFLAEGGFQLAAPGRASGQAVSSQLGAPVSSAAPPPPPPPLTIPGVKQDTTPVKPEAIPVKPDPGAKPVVKPQPAQTMPTSAIPVKPDTGAQPVIKRAMPDVSHIPVLPDPGTPSKVPAQANQPSQPVQPP